MWPRWQGSAPFRPHHHFAVGWATHRATGRRPGTPCAGRRRDREERGPRPTATVTIQGNVQWRKKWCGTWQLCYIALIGSISSAPLCSWKHWKVPPHVFQYTFYILVLAVFELIISGAYPSSLDSKAPYIKNEGSDSLTPFDLMLFWFSSCYIYVCQLAHAVKHRYAPILFSGINTSWNHSTFGQSIVTSSLRRWLFFCPRGLWDSLVFHDRGAVEEGVSKDVTGGSFSSDPGEDPCFVSGCD